MSHCEEKIRIIYVHFIRMSSLVVSLSTMLKTIVISCLQDINQGEKKDTN